MSECLRWGVLGAAGIARKMFLPAIAKIPGVTVTAIASRSVDNGKVLAGTFGIPRVLNSYNALIRDPDIDAIYVPLPNGQHVQSTLDALAAGKHVLCEKPIAMAAIEVAQIADAATAAGRHAIEGFMVAYHPQWEQVRKWINEGAIGTIRRIEGAFNYFLDEASNIRNHADGGALRDVGVYPIFISRLISGSEPIKVLGKMEFGAGSKADLSTSAWMQFEVFDAAFHVNTRADRTEFITVYGTHGRIEVPHAFNPPNQGVQSIHLFCNNALVETKTFSDVFQFALQVEHVSRVFLGEGAPRVTLENSAANQKVLDALRVSAHQQAWVSIL